MTTLIPKRLIWVGLGLVIILFYTTFVTARTYYNPAATALILFLGGLIAFSGLISSRLPQLSDKSLLEKGPLAKARNLFPTIFAATMVAVSADVIITLNAISTYGPSVEANKVVATLIQQGALLDWLGQQFTPVLMAAILFALVQNLHIRTTITFYTVGTLGYAAATVVNNLLVLYTLMAIR
ncbi:MAG: hypothetical protein HYU39_02030 [Thaumarchaeota archaeon]|nr:hypothetical protein [Nitrososphaerota archaeon]